MTEDVVSIKDPSVRERDFGPTFLILAFDPNQATLRAAMAADTVPEFILRIFTNPPNNLSNIQKGILLAAIGAISSSDLAELAQRVAALEAGGVAPPQTHTRYFGWSDDQVIETTDLAAAATSRTNIGILPARATNGYIWFAIPESVGYPNRIILQGDPDDSSPFYQQLPGLVNDPDNEPHIIGISRLVQSYHLAGFSLTLSN